MQRSYDVIVIGGGVLGLVTAAQLRVLGAGSVALIERRHVGAGESGTASGLLRRHDVHPHLLPLVAASHAELASFHQRTGRDIGYTPQPTLYVLGSEGRPAVEASIALQAQAGVQMSLLDLDDLRKLEPRARFEDAIGVLEQASARVDPVRALGALGAEATRLGVDIEIGVEALSVVSEAGPAGRRVSGVETSEGLVAARQVVAAAGPWTARLAATAGAELPLEIFTRGHARLHPPLDFGELHPALVDLPNDFCALPHAGGTRVLRLLLSPAPAVDPDACDPGASGDFLYETRSRVQRRLPAYGRSILDGGGTSPGCATPDRLPLAGSLGDTEGLFVAAGCGGDVFGLGVALGRALAEFVAHGSARAFDLERFDPERFRHPSGVAAAARYGIIG